MFGTRAKIMLENHEQYVIRSREYKILTKLNSASPQESTA